MGREGMARQYHLRRWAVPTHKLIVMSQQRAVSGYYSTHPNSSFRQAFKPESG